MNSKNFLLKPFQALINFSMIEEMKERNLKLNNDLEKSRGIKFSPAKGY